MEHRGTDKLEQELRRLRPARVSETLRTRIAAGIQDSVRVIEPASAGDRSWVTRWVAAAAALAAVFLAAVSVHISNGPGENGKSGPSVAAPVAAAVEKTPSDEFKPVVVRSEIVGQHDDGPVVVKDFGPARRVRYSIVDDVRWRNDRRNLTLSASVPREEVVLVALDTY